LSGSERVKNRGAKRVNKNQYKISDSDYESWDSDYSDDWESWPYSDEPRVEYDISNDFQNADSKTNVDKRYSKRVIDRSDWDDVSNSSDKKYRRFKNIV
jgi:hypothetical protein